LSQSARCGAGYLPLCVTALRGHPHCRASASFIVRSFPFAMPKTQAMAMPAQPPRCAASVRAVAMLAPLALALTLLGPFYAALPAALEAPGARLASLERDVAKCARPTLAPAAANRTLNDRADPAAPVLLLRNATVWTALEASCGDKLAGAHCRHLRPLAISWPSLPLLLSHPSRPRLFFGTLCSRSPCPLSP
jgi:hypothetical protein